ncbi:MAG: hypothetical protein QXD13_01350 [Candidatus Pacearchaeota archaeon]
MTKDELEERRERARYCGMTKAEAREELRNLNDVVFAPGVDGTVKELWDNIKERQGLINYLYDLELSLLDEDEIPFLKEPEFEKIERVREMIFEWGKIPSMIYNICEEDEHYFTGDIPAF